MAGKKIGEYSIGVKYEVDQKSIQDLQNSLRTIQYNASIAKPGEAMTESLKEAAKMAEQVSDVITMSFNKDLGTVNVTKFTQLMKQAGISVEQMATSFSSAGEAGTKAFAQMGTMIMNTKMQIKESNKLLSSLYETFTNSIRWSISSSVINNISGSIQKAYGFVQDLDKSLNDIRIVTGKSAEEMDKFAIKANQAAKNLGQTTTAYTEASLIYYQQGLDDKEAQARADVTLKAANVTGQSAEAVSEQLTAVWNGYKVSAEEAELYIDRLAAVAASSASDLEELSVGMSKVASAANAMGVGEEQLAAQISTIISTTRQAPESVGTALKTIYARMSDIKMGSDEAEITLGNYTAKMAQMGVNVLDANGQLREMGDVIEEIGSKWQSMSKEQQVALAQTMAGTRQYNNLIALFENWDQYTEMLNVASNAQGTLQEQEDIYMESTAAHLKTLKATWEDLYAAIFKTDEINTLIDLGTNLVQTFDNFFDSFGGGIKSIIAFGSIVANIFSKNIRESIIAAREEQQQFQNNLEVGVIKNQFAEALAQQPKATSAAGVQAQTSAQVSVEYYKEIEAIQSNISNEQYNNLTTLQSQLASLEGEKAALEFSNQELEKKKVISQELKEIVNDETKSYEDALILIDNNATALNTELDILQEIRLSKVGQSQYTEAAIKSLIEESELEDSIKVKLQEMLDIEDKLTIQREKEIEKEIKQLNLQEQYVNNAQKINEQQQELNLLKKEFDNNKTQALDTSQIIGGITAATSAMSLFASSIMNVNSLIQTWKDEEATFGQKMTSTFMTLGMLIPSIISSFSNLQSGLSKLKDFSLGNTIKNLALKNVKEKEAQANQNKINALQRQETSIRKLNLEQAKLETKEEEYRAKIEEARVARMKRTLAEGESHKAKNKADRADDNANELEEKAKNATENVNSLRDFINEFDEATDEYKEKEKQLQDAIADSVKVNIDAARAREKAEEAAHQAKEAETKLIEANTVAESANTAVDEAQIAVESQKSAVNVASTQVQQASTLATEADTAVVIAHTTAESAEASVLGLVKLKFQEMTAAMASNPIGLIIALIGALVAILIKLKNAEDERRQAAIDKGKELSSEEENIKNLTNEYEKLYKQYKESGKTTEDMIDSAVKLAESLDSEAAKVAALTGNWEVYTDSIRKARKEKAEYDKYELQKAAEAANAEINLNAAGEDTPRLISTTLNTDNESDRNNFNKILGKYNSIDAHYINTEYQTINGLGENQSYIGADNNDAITGYYELMEAYSEVLANSDNYSEGFIKEVEAYYNSLEKMSEDYDAAYKAQQDLFNNTMMDSIDEISENITNEDEYEEVKNKLKEKAKENGIKGISEEELDKWINEYLIANDVGDLSNYAKEEQQSNVYKEYNRDKAIKDITGSSEYEKYVAKDGQLTDSAQKGIDSVTEALTSLNMDNVISSLELTPEDYEKIFNVQNAEQAMDVIQDLLTKYSAQLKENFTKDAALLSDNAGSVLSSVRSGDIQSAADLEGNEDWDALSSRLDYIKQIYPEIADEVNILNSEAAVGTKEWAEALADVQDKMHALALDGLNKELSDTISELNNIDIDANPDKFEETMDKIMDAEYAIDVDLHAEGVQEFENAEAMLKNVADTAGKIGENFIVAADDVRELNQTFPGVLEGCQYLTDGTIQLSKESAEAAMTAASAEAQSANTAAIAKIQDEQKVLLAKAETYDSMAEIAESAAQGEVESKQAASQINQKIMQLNAENDVAATNAEIENDKIIADTSINNATAYGQNWIEAYNAVVQASAEATDAAQANQESLINGGGAVQNSLGRLTYNAIHQGTPASATEATINENDLDSIDWNAIAERYRSMANAARRDANDMDGMISELLAQGMKDNADLKSLGKGKGGGGGESKKDPEFIDYLEDERDRYHDINIQIALCEKALEKLNSQQKKLVGVDLAKNLMEQTKQLQKQVLLNKEKLKIMQKEKEELTETLSKGGVKFAEDGTIANYGDILADKLNYVNSLTEQYNKMSASEQENFKAIVEAAQKDYEKFKENIERYDELISEEMPEIEQKVQDLTDQKIDLQIEAFSIEINAKLNLAEAQRQWNQFLQDVVYKDKSTSGNAERMRQDLLTYYNPIKPKISFKDNVINTDITTGGFNGRNSIQVANGGIIQDDTNRVNELMKQLRQMEETGTSSVYGDNKQKLLEDLKAANDQLMEDMTNFEELVEQVNQEYLNAIDNVASTFETLNKEFEYTSSLIQHDMKIIQQLYGDDYAAMDKYYDKQTKNYNDQLSSQKEMVSYWKALMDKEKVGSDAWKKYKEEWQNATSELNSTVEASIENLLNKYQNTINRIMNDMNNKLTNGKGLNYTKSEWDLVKKESNMYLDNIEGAYAISQLQSKYQKSIDSTTSVTAQKRLNDLMNEEIGMLKEKDKLTQYDIDRANAKYDLTLKQIALEEARQNKSQMRLKRDSQGNYSYQYAADDAAIAEAEDGYNNALNKLYKIDKDEYNKNLDDIFNYYQEWQQKIAEAAQIKDNEERERTLRLYKEHYGNIINGLVEENEVIKQNLYESTEIALEEYYANNAEAFKNMTDEEKMVWMGEEGLIPSMLTSVQELVKQLADPETGFGYISGTVMQEIISVTEEYKQELADLEAAAGVNFKNIKNGIDPVIGAMNELIDKDKEELNEMKKQLKKTKEIKEEVDKLYKSYENVKNKAVEAATKAKEAWNDGTADGIDNLNKKILEMIANINKMISDINEGWKSIKTDYASPSPGGGSPSPVGPSKGTAKKSHTIQIFSHGSSYSNLKYIVEDGKTVKRYISDGDVIRYFTAKGVAERSVQMWLQNLNKSFTAQYDTGGYTGNWNSSEGKMAMLHEKELVLNKEDTKNMLNAVSIVRNMSGLLNSLNNSMLARVNAMQAIPSLSYASGSSGGGDIKQDIVINASFPDATNRDEISAAFENLLGRAAQYVNDKSL